MFEFIIGFVTCLSIVAIVAIKIFKIGSLVIAKDENKERLLFLNLDKGIKDFENKSFVVLKIVKNVEFKSSTQD